MVAVPTDLTDLLPTEHDAEIARQASHVLARYARSKGALQVEIADRDHREMIALPAAAVRLLLDTLTQMSEGNAVTLLPIDAELTTQQTADILNVSRPYLIKLLDGGEIPHRKVGTHRRVLLRDVMAYKQHVDSDRAQALDELTRQAEELNMGY